MQQFHFNRANYGYIWQHWYRDWSKREAVDYEVKPAVSLGYNNLLFPFTIIIGGIVIAGKNYRMLNFLIIHKISLHRNYHNFRETEVSLHQKSQALLTEGDA